MKVTSMSLWISCILCACVGYILLIRPDVRLLSSLVSQDARLEQQLSADLLLVTNSTLIRKQTNAADAILKKSGIELPVTLSLGHALRLLHTLAGTRHIVVDSVRLLSEDGNAKMTRIVARNLEIEIHGSFRNELAFFRELPKIHGVVLRLDGISFVSDPSTHDVAAHAMTSLLSLRQVSKP